MMTLHRHALYPVFAALAALAVIHALEAARLAAGAAEMQSLQGSARLAWAAALEKLSLSWYAGARDLVAAYARLADGAAAAARDASRFALGAALAGCIHLGIVLGSARQRPRILAWHLNLLAAGAFVAGILAPVLTVVARAEVPLLGDVILRYSSKSILSTVTDLAAGGNLPLALVITTFSVILPIVKVVLLALVLAPAAALLRTRGLALLQAIGKWTMVDVLVVAILVSVLALEKDPQSQAEVGLGLYFFLAYCLLTLWATQLAGRAESP
ncbi:MAG: paraquat-inducible protein A [Gammaproteobacteria bacterium]